MKKTLLTVAMALGMASSAMAQGTQVFKNINIVSGFNQDVICEANLTDEIILGSVTQLDGAELQGIDGGGFVFYVSTVKENGAMCGIDGIFKSERTGATFKVNPVALNALVLKGQRVSGAAKSGTLVFEAPTAAKSIYVVGTSSDGDSKLIVTTNYTDGTTEVDNITMYDWGANSIEANQAAVVKGMGRIMAKIGQWKPVGDFEGGNVFKMYESSVNTDNTKQIKSVTIAHADDSQGSATIFAVSTSDEQVSSGIAATENGAAATPAAIYNAAGQRQSHAVKGLNIIRMSDGTAVKVMK